MAEDEWNSEQLDILDELKTGRADKLFAYLLSGATLTTELRERIEALISEQGYRFSFVREMWVPGGQPAGRSISQATLSGVSLKSCWSVKWE